MENLKVTKLKDVITGRAVVYIDAANLEQSVKEMVVHVEDLSEEIAGTSVENLQWSVDHRKLNNFFRSLGIQNIRYYTAEFQPISYKNFLYFLHKELAFTLITKPPKKFFDKIANTPQLKANFDVEIAVDATFLMSEFDTIILFSGDCDFEYLIRFLREKEKKVVGFSRAENVATELKLTVNHYFSIIDFKKEFLKLGYRTGKAPSLATRDL